MKTSSGRRARFAATCVVGMAFLAVVVVAVNTYDSWGYSDGFLILEDRYKPVLERIFSDSPYQEWDFEGLPWVEARYRRFDLLGGPHWIYRVVDEQGDVVSCTDDGEFFNWGDHVPQRARELMEASGKAEAAGVW